MTTPDNGTTEITEHHPADHLCGQNHDPSLIRFARKCWQSGRESTSAQISALHSANEKLRGECERLRAQCARLITNSEIAMVIESEVKRSRYLITGTGQKVGMPKFSIGQVKWLERVFEDQRAMASKAEAARAAEGGD